jgi:protein NrfD
VALGGMGLFLLEAAAGTAALLLFFPGGPLGRGFFSLHGALAALFTILAVAAHPPGLPRTPALTGAALLALYALAAHGGAGDRAKPLLAAGALGCAWSLVDVARAAPHPHGDAWTVAGACAGGLFFGAVLLTMNLGHWYLISRTLPFRLLARGAGLFAALSVLRAALLLAASLASPNREGLAALLSLERDALFFLFRVLWGIAGPLALSYFIWKTARIRSNQAATGLLYVALIFVLIGELLSAYLTVATGFPA